MHLMVEAVDVVRDALKTVSDVNPTFMDAPDKAHVLVELARAEAQLTELRLRVLACADDLAATTAARDAGAWLAVATRTRRGDAAADVRLALALDRHHPALAAAMREGTVSHAQAQAIHRALDRLPHTIDDETRARAEHALLDHAADLDAAALTRLGHRILDLVAPEVAEAHEARALADLEANADRRARLTLRAQGDGTTRLSGLLPDATATRLATYLHAYTNPRASTGQATGDAGSVRADGEIGARTRLDEPVAGAPQERPAREPHPRRLAHAFAQLIEDLDPGRLPAHGGDATTLVVTMSLESLRAELATATLDTDLPGDATDRITADRARHLACRAKIIPAVLGGAGEVLDLGRARRLFSPAQNRALRLRDRHCRAEGCTIPGTWCESHHWRPWSRGGRTDLADGVLLCSHHHHRVHDPTYAAARLPDGGVRFTRRT